MNYKAYIAYIYVKQFFGTEGRANMSGVIHEVLTDLKSKEILWSKNYDNGVFYGSRSRNGLH